MEYRTESDSLGEMKVPAGALYGASTARAVENFPISGRRLPRPLIAALGWIKQAAAEVNGALGLLSPERAQAIAAASAAVARGEYDSEFPVDIYQTGSGTSSNMNANEVIARLAGLALGGGARVHPNDEVNRCQSSNDVFPSAVHAAVKGQLERALAPALQELRDALAEKADVFGDIIKSGRTHLQDAVPITLGREFAGYAAQLDGALRRVAAAAEELGAVALGGTAVGTGVNAHPEFAARAVARFSALSGLALREADDRVAAQACPDALLGASAALRGTAVSLMKIANDIRWLASGPKAGIGELRLPAVQPGSSIMPGKINPVIAESLLMACAAAVGNDAAVAAAAQWSNFELHTMWPLVGDRVLESIALLAAAAVNFARRLVAGMEVDAARCAELLAHNPSVAAVLAPVLGYDRVAEYVRAAAARGEPILRALPDAPGEYEVAGERVPAQWLLGPHE